jgi:predicted Zn-dependent peptidase
VLAGTERREEERMERKPWRLLPLVVVVLLGLWPVRTPAGSFEELEGKVQEFQLETGQRFLVLERHDAPVFTFFTLVNVGAVNEVAGITGLAHMFEHMAFKGTETLGTKDYEAEKKALEEVDRAHDALLAERLKGPRADPEKLERLEAAFKEAQEKASQYVETNRFAEIIEREGGRGINAFTTADFTGYFYQLPSNKLELWAILESDRFAHPVLREFYKERDVVIEERRRSSESTPMGRLFTELSGVAFLAHPYRDGVIGHRSDLEALTRRDAENFYRKYYVASNMITVVVGDVNTEEVKRLAEKYFSRIPTGPVPPPVRTVEPEQKAERRVILEEEAQPIVTVSYHIPSAQDPDWYAYEMLADILGSGRTSRLFETLVKKEKLASRVFARVGAPGEKYPNLLSVVAFVAKGKSPEEVEQAIYRELKRLVDEGVTPEELDKVRSRRKADFVRGVRSNMGLAMQLAFYQAIHGDWREMFRVLRKLEAIQPSDIQRIAKETFRKSNRTVGILRKPAPEVS